MQQHRSASPRDDLQHHLVSGAVTKVGRQPVTCTYTIPTSFLKQYSDRNFSGSYSWHLGRSDAAYHRSMALLGKDFKSHYVDRPSEAIMVLKK